MAIPIVLFAISASTKCGDNRLFPLNPCTAVSPLNKRFFPSSLPQAFTTLAPLIIKWASRCLNFLQHNWHQLVCKIKEPWRKSPQNLAAPPPFPQSRPTTTPPRAIGKHWPESMSTSPPPQAPPAPSWPCTTFSAPSRRPCKVATGSPPPRTQRSSCQISSKVGEVLQSILFPLTLL